MPVYPDCNSGLRNGWCLNLAFFLFEDLPCYSEHVKIQLGWALDLWFSVIERNYRFAHRPSLYFIHNRLAVRLFPGCSWKEMLWVAIESMDQWTRVFCESPNPSLSLPFLSTLHLQATLCQTSQAPENENLQRCYKNCILMLLPRPPLESTQDLHTFG